MLLSCMGRTKRIVLRPRGCSIQMEGYAGAALTDHLAHSSTAARLAWSAARHAATCRLMRSVIRSIIRLGAEGGALGKCRAHLIGRCRRSLLRLRGAHSNYHRMLADGHDGEGLKLADA